MLKQRANVGEIFVRQGEVVDIGRMRGRELAGAAVVDALGVRNGHVHKDKVGGGIIEQAIGCRGDKGVVPLMKRCPRKIVRGRPVPSVHDCRKRKVLVKDGVPHVFRDAAARRDSTSLWHV